MPSVSTCPRSQDLERLLLGLVSDGEAWDLERHLEQCAACRRSLLTLEADDLLVEAARTAAEEPALIDAGDVVSRLIERLSALAVARAGRDGEATARSRQPGLAP